MVKIWTLASTPAPHFHTTEHVANPEVFPPQESADHYTHLLSDLSHIYPHSYET